MSNGFASALEISARILREHTDDHATARRLITERLQAHPDDTANDNQYLMNMNEGYKSVLAGLYVMAQRDQ